MLAIRYQPPLPEIDFIEPPERVVYDGPTGQPPLVTFSARLKLRQDQQPFRATILVNGTEMPQVPTLDKAGGRLTARITPAAGRQPNSAQAEQHLGGNQVE